MSSPAASLKSQPALADWVQAARPKTLVAAVVPVLVGTAMACVQGGARTVPAIAALCGALLIQIGTNLTNDYYDFVRGADGPDRLGPLRVTQAGLIAPGTVMKAAVASFGLAAVVGVYLATEGGWPIVAVGVLSIASGYAYTGGPYPLGYHGLGDLFVFVFFGPVAVSATAFVQTHHAGVRELIGGAAVGALSTALLVVNNLRDVESDSRAGKRTLVVRLGPGVGRVQYLGAVAIALVAPLLLCALSLAPTSVLLALLAGGVAIKPARVVLSTSGRELNSALGGTARLLTAYGLLLTVGLVVAAP